MNEPRDWLCAEALMCFTLVIGVGLWSPTFFGVLDGSVDFPVGMLRLALSLLVAWAAVHIVARMIDSYRATNNRSELATSLERHRKQLESRRRKADRPEAGADALDRELEADELRNDVDA